MRKIFLTLIMAVAAIAATATDYTGTLTVTVDGTSTNTSSTISVTDNGGGSYTLSINNFELDNEGSPIPVGNIVLNTTGTSQNEATILNAKETITIAAGDDSSKDWIGPYLGEVPINMIAIFKDGAMFVNIDIYMALLEQTINVRFASEAGFTNRFGANEGYQIPNSNFEDWTASSGEPDYWHGFKSCKGSMSSLVGIAGMSLAKSTDKHSGTYSAVLTSGSALGTVANGTMTTGQLNAGSRTATDVSNHSEMDKSSTATDNNNKPFYTNMFGRPDAIKTWVKFSQNTANASHPHATISAIIFDGSYYQDPEDKTYTNVTAKAKNNTIAVTDWTEITFPFTGYTTVAPQAILITASTNADPGQGSKGDKLWVDDLEIVYYGDVTNITVNGLDGFTFNANTHTYNIEAAGTFTENDINVTKTGNYSYLLKSVNAVEGGYIITVVVIPNDMSKAEVYTINVTTPAVTLEGVEFTSERKWATWYDNQNLALPENVTAYVVEDIYNDVAQIRSIGYLPKNVGVLLYSETPASNVTALPYSGTTSSPYSLLEGSVNGMTVNNDCYLLYNNCFVLAQNSTLAPHRCCLTLFQDAPAAPSILRIGNSTVTAITDIEAKVGGKVRYYDLNGREVNENATGILIRRNADGTVTKIVK